MRHTALRDATPQWKATFGATFYASGTVVATGSTAVTASPGVTSGSDAVFPLAFVAIGADMLTDETNDLTIDWYFDASGTVQIGTTTFDQLTAGSLIDVEAWPGDVTAYNAGRDMVPLFPYYKITHTLGGTTKSMSYTIYYSYLQYVA